MHVYALPTILGAAVLDADGVSLELISAIFFFEILRSSLTIKSSLDILALH